MASLAAGSGILFVMALWQALFERPRPQVLPDPWEHWVVTTNVRAIVSYLAVTFTFTVVFGALAFSFFAPTSRRLKSRLRRRMRTAVVVVATLTATVLLFLSVSPAVSEPSFGSQPLPQVLAPLVSSGGLAFKTQWLAPDDLAYASGSVSCPSDTCFAIHHLP
jgi:hypothetical protein